VQRDAAFAAALEQEELDLSREEVDDLVAGGMHLGRRPIAGVREDADEPPLIEIVSVARHDVSPEPLVDVDPRRILVVAEADVRLREIERARRGHGHSLLLLHVAVNARHLAGRGRPLLSAARRERRTPCGS
jgi:hypothetical protein